MDQTLQDAGGTMPANEAAFPSPPDAQAKELAARIRRMIRRRTGGGVHQLRVDISPDTIRLSGSCSTYYCRQLAQQAAMLLGGPRRVDDCVVVQYEEH